MIITVNSVGQPQQEQKGNSVYNTISISYTKEDGGTSGKKLVDFAQPDVYNFFKGLSGGETVEVKAVKNGKFWNWESARVTTKAAVPASGDTNMQKKTWVPEKDRQQSIVRQSSLAQAVATLVVGRKSKLDPHEVVEVAKFYEGWVNRTSDDEYVDNDPHHNLPDDDLEDL